MTHTSTLSALIGFAWATSSKISEARENKSYQLNRGEQPADPPPEVLIAHQFRHDLQLALNAWHIQEDDTGHSYEQATATFYEILHAISQRYFPITTHAYKHWLTEDTLTIIQQRQLATHARLHPGAPTHMTGVGRIKTHRPWPGDRPGKKSKPYYEQSEITITTRGGTGLNALLSSWRLLCYEKSNTQTGNIPR